MKSLLTVLVACAFAWGLNLPCAFAYPEPIAVITNYESDHLAGKISIVRANGVPPGSELLLYPNDQITGEYYRAQLKLHPYAKDRSTGSSRVIEYTPPTFWERTKDKVGNLIDSFFRTVEYYSRFASKGAADEVNLKPQPGFDVTLLSGQKVTFSWYDPTNKNFLIKDDKGKKVLEKKIIGLTSIELNLNDLKLQRGKHYFWSVDGDPQVCKMTLLDEKTEKEILSTLDEIDSKDHSENERLFEKVTYLQFISDTYPDQIDLYWLSTQWLLELKPTTNDESYYQEFLLDKCSRNLTDKMSKN